MNSNTAPASGKLRIDVHVHMVSTRDDRGAFIKKGALHQNFTRALADFRHSFPPAMRWLKNSFDNWYVGSLARKVRESKHIDRAVLLAFDGIYLPGGGLDMNRTLACMPNDLVREAAAQYPGELLWGASVNPSRPDAIDELERCASLGAVLNKWVPNTQDIDASDKKFTAFYDKMAELKMPLLSHTGYEHAMNTYDQSLGDPRRLTLPLERGVTVIAGHAGSSGTDDPVEYFGFFLEMLDKYPNLYGDLAALTWTNRKYYLMFMINERPELFDRMVHGTDYPVPVIPAVFKKEIGLGKALSMQFGNYFDVEAGLKLMIGMPESVLSRASGLLLFRS